MQRHQKLSQPTSIPECPIFHSINIEVPWSLPHYQRNLPHLRIEGAIYFVTFRLADSIPKAIMEQWQEDRQHWFRMHGLAHIHPLEDPILWEETYFNIPHVHRHEFELLQRRRFYAELNQCHGSCVLAQSHDIVSAALEFFHGKRIWTGDYVVMPNHVHILVQMFPGVKLEEWLYSIKRFTAYNIGKRNPSSRSINPDSRNRQHFWREESHDRIARNALELARMRRYIAKNPTKLSPGTFSMKQMQWLDEFEHSL